MNEDPIGKFLLGLSVFAFAVAVIWFANWCRKSILACRSRSGSFRFLEVAASLGAIAGLVWVGLAQFAEVPGPTSLFWCSTTVGGSTPLLVVVWAVVLAFRMGPDANASSPFWKHLLVFYSVTGAVSLWASTWTFTREGHTGHIFSPATTLVVACVFAIPIAHLIVMKKRMNKTPNQSMQSIGTNAPNSDA